MFVELAQGMLLRRDGPCAYTAHGLCSPGDFVVDVVSGAVTPDLEASSPSLKESATELASSSIAALWRKHQPDFVGESERARDSTSLASLGARKQVLC